MEFGSIITEDGVFNQASYDGILGLSYPSLSDSTLPFFDRIIQKEVLPHNIFSIYLSRDKHVSFMYLGGYDKNFFSGPIQYHKVIR